MNGKDFYQCTKCNTGSTTPYLVPMGTKTINSETVPIFGCAQMQFTGAIDYQASNTLKDNAGLDYMIPKTCQAGITTGNSGNQKLYIPSFAANPQDSTKTPCRTDLPNVEAW